MVDDFNNLPIGHGIRLGRISSVNDSFVEVEFFDRFLSSSVRCPIPHPYPGRGGGVLIGPEKDTEAMLFLFPVGLTFYPDKFYKKGVKLITYEGERFMPTSKTKHLLMSYIAYREAQKNNAIDALLIDKEGNIAEGTRSSFFVIKGNALTAPPKEKVLEGVTRKIILEIAPNIMNVKEGDIPLEKIKEYDEHFITGTTLKVMPVRQINKILLRKEVGDKVKELQKLFKEYCDSKVLE